MKINFKRFFKERKYRACIFNLYKAYKKSRKPTPYEYAEASYQWKRHYIYNKSLKENRLNWTKEGVFIR